MDQDGDGHEAGFDCDDGDPAVHPEAAERCNGLDDDCDGYLDEDIALLTCFRDADGDGYGDELNTGQGCSCGEGYVAEAGDCDDVDAGVHPQAEEICGNGVDEDCDESPGDCGEVVGDMSLIDASARFEGLEYDDKLGYALVGGLDLLGDGQPDFVAGAPGEDDDPGTVYVFGGGDQGERWEGHLTAEEASAVLTGEIGAGKAGAALAAAGDVNQDGYGDLLVGASPANLAYLVHGPVSGTLGLETVSLQLTGESGTSAGTSLAGLGDVDGDQWPDLLVGATGVYRDGESAGAAYLVHGPISDSIHLPDDAQLLLGEGGGQAGWSVAGIGDVDGDGLGEFMVGDSELEIKDSYSAGAAYLFLDSPSEAAELADAQVHFEGATRYAALAISLCGAGDHDGDGYDDFAIGAWGDNPVHSSSGIVYLWLGCAEGFGASPVSLSDAAAIFDGEEDFDEAGQALASAGDVDADGRDDLLIGTPDQSPVGVQSGRTYLLLAPQEGRSNLYDADALLDGEYGQHHSGYAVAGAGDADGDGYGDFIVGAPFFLSDAGAVYLQYGGEGS